MAKDSAEKGCGLPVEPFTVLMQLRATQEQDNNLLQWDLREARYP
jgi:hypothetical protein